MKRNLRQISVMVGCLFLLTTGLVAMGSTTAWSAAQSNDDPFGDFDDPFGDFGDDTFGTPPAPATETAADDDPFNEGGTNGNRGNTPTATTPVDTTAGQRTPPALPRDPTLITDAERDTAPIGVQALLLTKPESPADLIRIGRMISNLSTPELGNRLLLRVQKMALDEETLADLGETLPSDTLLAIGTDRGLQPVGAELSEAISAAYRRRLEKITPQRIDALFETLIGDESKLSPEELSTLSTRRDAAMASLQRMGDYLVPYLLERLGRDLKIDAGNGTIDLMTTADTITDPTTRRFWRMATHLTAALGESAIPVLVAAMDSNDERTRLTALCAISTIRPSGLSTTMTGTIGQGGELFVAGLGDDSATVRAATAATIRATGFPIRDPKMAAAQFAETATGYLISTESPDSQLPTNAGGANGEDAASGFWQWNVKSGRLECAMLTPIEQQRQWAIRYAAAAMRLQPTNVEYRRLYDIAVAQDAIFAVVFADPANTPTANGGGAADAATAKDGGEFVALPFEQRSGTAVAAVREKFAVRPTPELAATLSEASRRGAIPATIVLARLLEERPDAVETLRSSGGDTPPALVQLLFCSEPRTRFMAASALVQMNPDHAWPMAHRLPGTLAFFASSTGSRRAVLVGFPYRERELIRGFCADAGYECEWCGTGSELMRMADELFDTELILIAVQVDQPTVEFLISQIRRDARLAGIPVGVLVDESGLARAGRIADRDARTLALAIPTDDQTARTQFGWLENLGRWTLPTVEERGTMARRAMAMLSDLSVQYTKSQSGDTTGEVPATDRSPSGFTVDPASAEWVMLRAAVYPAYSALCIPYMAERGTAACQRTLLTIADSELYPEPVRRQALAGLERAISLRSTLLTRTVLQQQYDRFNATRADDTTTRAIRSEILDVLEKPIRTRSE